MIAVMASLGAFAAGYLMRPLGGIIFGHLGDRYGRNKAFTWSIFLVVIPTFIIGVLPSYEKIGMMAPIILILCRLMQGLCNGGEFSGAGIFIGEHLPNKHSGLGGSLVCATGILGAAIGTAFGAVVTLPGTPEWGFRLPFIVGSVFTLVSWNIRRNMIETPPFERISRTKSIIQYPLLQVLKDLKVNAMCALMIGGFGHVLLYTSTIYMNVLYTTTLKLPPSVIMRLNTAVLLWWVLLSPVMGIIADKVGVRKFMFYCTLAAITFVYPLFTFLNNDITLYKILAFQFIFAIFGAGFVAPISSLFTAFFPVKQRYSGVAFSVTMGQALLGGTTPLIATFLTEHLGDPRSPAYFVILCGLAASLALIKLSDFSADGREYIMDPRWARV